ncbi:hypothetical protein DENSPDRAFT_299149 [Dentipellis sp. KUC8613]|nr:hypothetical protein DENSPDRAFT_299149 [Dentipellis sp. KUC8613]
MCIRSLERLGGSYWERVRSPEPSCREKFDLFAAGRLCFPNAMKNAFTSSDMCTLLTVRRSSRVKHTAIASRSPVAHLQDCDAEGIPNLVIFVVHVNKRSIPGIDSSRHFSMTQLTPSSLGSGCHVDTKTRILEADIDRFGRNSVYAWHAACGDKGDHFRTDQPSCVDLLRRPRQPCSFSSRRHCNLRNKSPLYGDHSVSRGLSLV